MKTNKLISCMLTLAIIFTGLLISYFIFNLIIFMIVTGMLLIMTPIIYAHLNKQNKKCTTKLTIFEIIICSLFAIIILGFNHFIIMTERFKDLANSYLINDTVSIQEFNIVTYIVGIAIYVGIYYFVNRKLTKESNYD